MLRAQECYGRHSAQIDLGAISLGRRLFPTVPEDSFDRKPLARGPFALVADVRLDNRDDLARSLGVERQQLARMSDSDVLFECLLAWREDTPDRLAGEFAFAFWDGTEHSLLLARDVIGHRPLHFHRAADFFAFATMPSGLHALPEVPREFDGEFMAESLALLPHAGPNTHYRGIERVQPAHLVRVGKSGIVRERYWNPEGHTKASSSPREYEEELRRLVDQAVSAQLRGAEGQVATHLSSGLDSSIVTSTAARLIDPDKVVAFTAVPRSGFDGPVPAGVICNEGEIASATARLYPNVEHVTVESSAESPFSALEQEHFYQQQPVANLCNAVWGRQINRIASKRGIKVLLIGNVGNISASYSGMEWLSALIARGQPIRALRTARALARNGVPWRTLGAQMIGPFLPETLWRLACRIHRRPVDLAEYSAVSPLVRGEIEAKARKRGFDLSYRPSKDPFALRLSVLADGDGGYYYKGMLGQWGLSLRDPLADKRLLDFCLSVPPAEYVRDGRPRSLARRAFTDRLPRAVTDAGIRGFQSPDWFEAIERDLGTLRAEAEMIARCESASSAMDMDWLRRAVADWPSEGWERQEVVHRYRYGMLRAVSAGHFMRKVAGSN